MPIEQIDSLVKEHMKSPPQRTAQHTLAREFVELVHGVKEANHAEAQHRLVFAKNTMTAEEYAAAEAKFSPTKSSEASSDGSEMVNSRPTAHLKLPRSAMQNSNLGKVLLAC